jgi:hypothetical protein
MLLQLRRGERRRQMIASAEALRLALAYGILPAAGFSKSFYRRL